MKRLSAPLYRFEAMGLRARDLGKAVLVLGWAAAGAAIPAAPAAVGTFDAMVRHVMEKLGTAPARAIVYAVLVHVLVYSTMTMAGLVFMSFEGLSLAKFSESAEKHEEKHAI